MNENDVDLVHRSLSERPGASEAFARLVARYRPAIYGLAFAATGDATEAEDLTQEVLIAAYLGLPHLREPARFGAWLKGIARNVLRMWYRRRAATPEMDGGHALEKLDAGTKSSPEAHIDRQERLARIRQAVQALSTGNQQAVALRYWAGISYAEISEELDVPMSTVKSRLHKAKRQLRTQLVEQRIERKEKMIPVTVGEIYAREYKSGPYAIVSLDGPDGQSLPIWIGPAEASWLAVNRVLGDDELTRPLTINLVANMLTQLDVKVNQVVVSALKDTTYYATLYLTHDQTQYEIDARPSDAINLAICTGAPIYVAAEVMDDAGKAVPDDLPEDIQPFELPDWVLDRLSELKKRQDT